MNSFLKCFLLPCLIGLILVSSCRGPEGPRGPEGSQGPQGQAGADGLPGTPGTDGNANVTTYLFNVAESNYYFDGTWWQVDLSVPAITKDIEDNGMVMVYLRRGGYWRALPFVFVNSGYSDSVLAMHRQGQVRIRLVSSRDNPLKYAGLFKVVVVEGNPGKRELDLNWDNYEEVAAALGLDTEKSVPDGQWVARVDRQVK
ncbi:MAG: collagen-like protein [Bacteroidota bacterium]